MSEVKEEIGDSLDERTQNPVKYEQNLPEEEEELLNIRIPTQTKKSQKRKHIRTDFDAVYLDESVLEAQRLEKQRLDRLEKSKTQNDHLQQMEFLLAGSNEALPQLDISNNDFMFDDFDDEKRFKSEFQKPSTSKGPVDLVDLTEDSDDDCMITDVRSMIPQPARRMRWAQAEKDRLDADQMEAQHSVEAQRIKKARSQKDLESTEKCGGRLLVNSGHPSEDPDVFVISHLTHVLQPHQLGGVRFMYDNTIESIDEFKKSDGFGCILAHSMGLGKTIQVITFSEIFLRATKAKKIVIIVPVNTIQNWFSEYEKWIPKFSDCGDRIRQFDVFLLGDSVKTFDQRVNLIEQWDEKGGVLLIGYDMFRSLIKSTQPKKEKKGRPKLNLSGVSSVFGLTDEAAKKEEDVEFETGFTNGGRVRQEAFDSLRRALLDPGPDLVVCDEGHKIKNITAEISMTLGAIKTKRRIVLTGYPLQNNLLEYFCMIDFVRPRYLGTRKSFVERFEKPIKNGQCVDSTDRDVKVALQRTHVLVELVKGFVQRRTHHLLKKILPESKEYVLLLRKSQIQRMLYRNFVLYAKSEIAKGNGDCTFNPLMAFSACSKFWNHPDILYRLVEQIKKTELAAEEKKRAAEMAKAVQMQQQQQIMHNNGLMMGYGGSPYQQQQQQQNMMIQNVATISRSLKLQIVTLKPTKSYDAMKAERKKRKETAKKFLPLDENPKKKITCQSSYGSGSISIEHLSLTGVVSCFAHDAKHCKKDKEQKHFPLKELKTGEDLPSLLANIRVAQNQRYGMEFILSEELTYEEAVRRRMGMLEAKDLPAKTPSPELLSPSDLVPPAPPPPVSDAPAGSPSSAEHDQVI
uniref:Helicase ATP-binding domain-containing protein n=1 Tax=Caenorhabditis japonica TaxID=281687 RepID=A0A8R1HQ66_CAEJA